MAARSSPKYTLERRREKAVTPDIMAAILNNSTRAVRELVKFSLGGARALLKALIVMSFVSLTACVGVPERRKDAGFAVMLPFMRMDGGECYYLDDFMPTPDNMVSGKSSGLHVRYYTFRSATYKAWEQERVMLAFYSRDNRCWSLFEEYSTGRF